VSGKDKPDLSDEEKAALKAAGEAKRQERKQAELDQKLAAQAAEFERQRKLTAQMLDAIGAPNLIVVDDDVGGPGPYLAAVGIVGSDARGEQLDDIVGDEVDYDFDSSAWERKAQAKWRELEPETRERLLAEAETIRAETYAARYQLRPHDALEAMEQLFPEGRLMLLHPDEWNESGEDLTEGDPPPMLLFDQVLGGSTTGMDLLKAYRGRMRTRLGHDPPAGILSTEVTREGEMRSQPAGEEEKVDVGSRILISKEYLRDGDYDQAIQQFRLTANLPHLDEVRQKVGEGLQADLDAALARLQLLPLEVLEDLVYRSSWVEGAAEEATLIRIIGLYVTEASRRRQLEQSLNEPIVRARRLTRTVTTPHEKSPETADLLHQVENYAPAEWINKLQLPLANGDLFEVIGAGEADGLYVLVCQPCDLAVRNDGHRSAAEARLLPLVEVAEKGDDTVFQHRLAPVPDLPVARHTAALLNKGFFVPLHALDLCWMNEAGEAVIEDSSHLSAEPLLTVGLDRRRRAVFEMAAARLGHIAKVTLISPDEAPACIQHQTAGELPLQYEPDNPRRWAYPVRRVGRLSDRQAEALLVRHATAQARAAFDHPLTRFEEDEPDLD